MECYKYYNCNPLKRITGDCVIRATSKGLDISWEEANRLLYNNSLELCHEMSCVGNYGNLFEYKLNLKPIEFHGTIKEFIKENPIGKYIIRIKGHLTCLEDGTIYDIWDCTDKEVSLIWRVR